MYILFDKDKKWFEQDDRHKLWKYYLSCYKVKDKIGNSIANANNYILTIKIEPHKYFLNKIFINHFYINE